MVFTHYRPTNYHQHRQIADVPHSIPNGCYVDVGKEATPAQQLDLNCKRENSQLSS